MKRTALLLAVLATLLTSASQVFAGHTLSAKDKGIVDAWLSKHERFRLADDSDCACAADIRTLRERGYGGMWKRVPDYHPYIATGDFNGDGIDDIAVAVVDRSRKTKRFTLLVFNGPFDTRNAAPAFVERNMDMRGTGLFYGPPRPKPYRLVLGPFESEGYVLVPKGKTYIKDISTVGE